MQRLEEKILKVVDVFAGAGGLSLGFEMSGFQTVAAFDNWSDALITLKRNNPLCETFLVDMASKEDVEEALESLHGIDVVVGGPPCQGFSIAGKRNPDDPRNRLYQGFVQTISILKPKAFVMENVPTIASPTNSELFAEILKDFRDLGYQLSYGVLLASDYGVPQNRKRMFVVGMNSGKGPFIFPEKQGVKVTTKDAISDLPEDSVEDGIVNTAPALSDYQRLMRRDSNRIWNHQVTHHSAQTVRIISQVPDGGNYKDLPPDLQNIRNVNIAWTRFSSISPSHTIDTGHRHHFHFEFNRVPTVRESARLQSFPDSFIFSGSKTSQYRQVGNAVPPLLARAIATALLEQL